MDGRDFSRAFTTDSSGFVINEAAVKYMGLKNPVGKTITFAANGGKAQQYKILGIIKDMVMNSPFEPAYPTVFNITGGMGAILIKINPNKSAGEALPKIRAIFKNLVPAALFDYTFVNEEYGKKFAAEERIGKLIKALRLTCDLDKLPGFIWPSLVCCRTADQRNRHPQSAWRFRLHRLAIVV